MTDLEDMKVLWAEHDRKIEKALRLNRRLLEESALGRAKTSLGSVRKYLVLDLVGNAAWLVAMIAFAWAFPQVRFLVPAALLVAGSIALVRGDVLQLIASKIDQGEPIAVAQRRLESLRRLRVTHVRWVLLLGPLAWAPLSIVALKALFGVDAWVVPGVAWIVANVALGVAVLVTGWVVSVRYGERLQRSSWAARAANAISGRSVADAMRALAAIEELEDE